MADRLSEEERVVLTAELEHLREEHRDLDSAIEALTNLATADRLQIQRLKKRKLVLRDKIAQIEDQLTPDIIA
ncbi:MAG: YdcH family protein [Methylovirgula sp.]